MQAFSDPFETRIDEDLSLKPFLVKSGVFTSSSNFLPFKSGSI